MAKKRKDKGKVDDYESNLSSSIKFLMSRDIDEEVSPRRVSDATDSEEDAATELQIALMEIKQCENIAAKALGYSLYSDMPTHFPTATEEDGYAIGDHSGSTIVAQLAERLAQAEQVISRLATARTDDDRAVVEQMVDTYMNSTPSPPIAPPISRPADVSRSDVDKGVSGSADDEGSEPSVPRGPSQ